MKCFLFLKFSLRKKQNKTKQPAASKTTYKHFCSLLGLRHQHYYTGRAFMGTDVTEDTSQNLFIKNKIVNLTLIMSSGHSGKVSACELQSNFRCIYIWNKSFKMWIWNISASMIHAPLWFAGLNMGCTHENGYVRSTEGLLSYVEGHASTLAFGSQFIQFKLSTPNYLLDSLF